MIPISPAVTTAALAAVATDLDPNAAADAPPHGSVTAADTPPATTHGDADPLARFGADQGLHRDVKPLAGNTVLYSAPANAAPAVGATQQPAGSPVPWSRMREIAAVLVSGGDSADLHQTMQGTSAMLEKLAKQGVRFELRSGADSYYDATTKTMVLGANASAADQARAIWFETRKLVIDQHKLDTRRDLGNRDYDRANYRTNGHADPALRERYMPKTRDAYVKDKLDTVAQAAADTVEFAIASRKNGGPWGNVPLEHEYISAYTRTAALEYGRIYAKTGSHVLARNGAEDAARAAGRAAVMQAVHAGKLPAPDTKAPYADGFNRAWDAKVAQQAKETAELEKVRAANAQKAEQQAKVDQGRKALVDLIKAVDPKSADAQVVIKLVHAFVAQHPEQQVFLLGDARDALAKLLGPYGFRTVEDVGSIPMERARLDYALENFHRLTPAQRNEVVADPRAAARHGISATITYQEMQARESQFVNMRLPDGTNFQGTRAEYREAARRNVINHALGQLNQIRSAGPASLIGRMVAGEKGAAIGGLFDGLLMATGRARTAANDSTADVTGGRTPTNPRVHSSAPPKPPAREIQPDRPGAVRNTTQNNVPAGPSATPNKAPNGTPNAAANGAQNGGAGGAHNSGQNNAANNAQNAQPKRPMGETKVDNDTGGADADRVARRNQAARAQRSAQREAETARRVREANQGAEAIRQTMPAPNQPISAEQAIDGMRTRHWPTVASMNPRAHAEAWREAGNTGEPPIAWRDGNVMRIDFRRLTPDQQRVVQDHMTRVPAKPAKLPADHEPIIDPNAKTHPHLTPSQINGDTLPQK